MKIPVKRIELATMPEGGYDGYWVEGPRSVKEGWFNELAQLTRGQQNNDPAVAREANLRIFELLTAWNLTDDNEQPLPLIRDVESREEKLAVMAEIPMDVIAFVVRKLLGVEPVAPQTQDF